MARSSLCTYTNITGNRSRGRSGQRVCKITPHYMAAKWTGRQCADYFAGTGRQASSNYCIGAGGDIAMSVDEDDRAWTSLSAWNDNRAITIECANNPDSSLTDATWNSLVNLCVDICRRYGFRLTYDGSRSGSLTEHRMFASTACPGAWLHARMGELARQVNARLDGSQATGPNSGSGASGKPADAVDFAESPLLYDGYFGPETVRQVQHGLRAKGYYPADKYLVDGDFGVESAKALQKYLRDLGHYPADKYLVDGDFGVESVKALQKHLRSVGCYWDEQGWCLVDGDWGSLTTIALQRAINGNLF